MGTGRTVGPSPLEDSEFDALRAGGYLNSSRRDFHRLLATVEALREENRALKERNERQTAYLLRATEQGYCEWLAAAWEGCGFGGSDPE